MSLVETGPQHIDELADIGRQIVSLSDAERDDYLGGLSLDELAVAEAAVAAAEAEGGDWRADPAQMSHKLSRGRFKLWPYWRLLGQKFADAVEGRSKRQIWNMPPRYGKSQMASQWGPAWALDRQPDKTIMLVSYGETLALENAIGVRDILKTNRDVLRAQLRTDRRARARFVTTSGGGVVAGGIGGGLTGFPGDGIVFDDPFKDEVAAASKATRDRVDGAFRSVLGTRVETEETWIIVVMTRWHEDDLTGRLIARMLAGDGEPYEVVRIPDIAEHHDPDHHSYVIRLPDPLGRAPGEIIEPERFSPAMVEQKHLAAGSYFEAAMYQQRPAPEEGSEIKRHWFRKVSQLPPRYDIEITSWDMKLKDKESGDYVVGQHWGRVAASYYLSDQLRGQWNQATTENAIALMAVRYPNVRAHYIENTGNGPEVMEALRNGHPGYEVSDELAGLLGMSPDERAKVSALRQRGIGNLLPVNPKGPKPVRMRAVSGYIEGGSVFLLETASFRGVYLDEMASFPNGHDDQVDATSQALSKLIGSQATVSRPGDMPMPKAPISTRGGGTTGVNTGTRLPGPQPGAGAPLPRPAGGGNISQPARIIYPHRPPTSR
ncbi:MAG: terminase large subunit domain-containing protein [Acidimicrobiales bacterium]